MASSQILLLGGTGPTGICLLRELLHRDHSVVVYARSPNKVTEDISSSALVKIHQGSLDDKKALNEAIAGCSVVISLLGPQISDRSMEPNVISDFYKNVLFPAMRQHGVRRVYAMGTASIARPEDSRSILASCLVLLVRLAANNAYRTIVNIGEVFENDAKDLDWTVYRICNIPGDCDKESWARDREDGRTFVGWIGETGWSVSQERAALARWLVDAAEGGTPEWVRKMPAVSRLAGT